MGLIRFEFRSIFFIPLHDGDLFLRLHSERTILLQYMFQITVIIITFSYKQKKYIFVN